MCSFSPIALLGVKINIYATFSLQSGRTAVFYASQNGHLGAVQALWDRGADVSIADKVQIRAVHRSSEC